MDDMEVMLVLRSTFRARTLETVNDVITPLGEHLSRVLNAPEVDAKAVDALSRSILNLEKTAASAAGENRRQESPSPGKIEVVFPAWATDQRETGTIMSTETQALSPVRVNEAMTDPTPRRIRP